jgi:hypothetical protein
LNLKNLGIAKPLPTLQVIKENLANPHTRHLMVLTDHDAALQIMLENGAISHTDTKFFFGSDYEHDKSDAYVCRVIQQIRNCMEKGDKVVLVHQDALYEGYDH